MRIASATSLEHSPVDAIQELRDKLKDAAPAGERPSFVLLHGIGSCVDATFRSDALQHFPGATLHGGTASQGVLANDWNRDGDLPTCGALAIYDKGGDYGSASTVPDGDVGKAAAKITREALRDAGREGEAPDLVVLTAALGQEEDILAGIRSVVGDATPIVGGGAAIDPKTGKWATLCNKRFQRGGMVVSVLFSTGWTSLDYQNGFAPFGPNGTITAANRRQIIEIDERPAMQVYSEWTKGAVPFDRDQQRMIASEATFFPLGRVTSFLNNVPFHLLTHPWISQPDGTIEVFTDMRVGDRLWLMNGTRDNLISRIGQVVRAARGSVAGPKGGLVILCAGYLEALEGRMGEVSTEIELALGDAPYLALFTLGEQAAAPNCRPEHGNLMISCTVFNE